MRAVLTTQNRLREFRGDRQKSLKPRRVRNNGPGQAQRRGPDWRPRLLSFNWRMAGVAENPRNVSDKGERPAGLCCQQTAGPEFVSGVAGSPHWIHFELLWPSERSVRTR